MKSERRTQYQIYWEILVFCKTPRSFTGIIGRCDLNSKTGQDYLGFLESRGYLFRVQDDGKTLYVATEAGKGVYPALQPSLPAVVRYGTWIQTVEWAGSGYSNSPGRGQLGK